MFRLCKGCIEEIEMVVVVINDGLLLNITSSIRLLEVCRVDKNISAHRLERNGIVVWKVLVCVDSAMVANCKAMEAYGKHGQMAFSNMLSRTTEQQ